MRRETILRALKNIPEFIGVDGNEIAILELGGTSNRNFRVRTPAGAFALRIPSEDRAGFVSRAWEIEAARQAAEAGIGAPLVHADAGTGIMLTRWIDGALLTGAMIRSDPELLGRAARLLRRLHDSGRRFPRRFDAFAIMEDYRRTLIARGRGAVPWSDRVSVALDRIRDALFRSPLPDVPSHCDPFPQNFLDDGERITLIDWEYAGMNDPAWDLAYFALESGLGGVEIEALLRAYGDARMGAGRLRSYQLVAACLGVLWSELRDAAGEGQALRDWAGARLSIAETLAAEG